MGNDACYRKNPFCFDIVAYMYIIVGFKESGEGDCGGGIQAWDSHWVYGVC